MKEFTSIKFLLYFFLILILSVVIQTNITESIGISFFIIMTLGGIVYKIIKKPTIRKEESRETILYKAITELGLGLGIMILVVFLYLNIMVFTRGSSFAIGTIVLWLGMIVGITNVWFGVIDLGKLCRKKNNPEEKVDTPHS